MKPSLFLALCFLLSLPKVAISQDRKEVKGVLKVVADGAGASHDEAVKDALKNAVRQAIGTFVDAVSQVENDRVIKETILVYSDGFVEKFDVLPETSKVETGIYRVSILAEVRKKNLLESLKKADISSGEIDGVGLFAEATTKHEANLNAEAMLFKLLKDFPAAFTEIKTLGEPKIVNQNDETATCEFTFHISFNSENYAAFHGPLNDFLKEVATERKRASALFERLPPRSELDRDIFQLKKSDEFLKMVNSTRGLLAVALCNPTKKQGERLEFQFFALEDTIHRLFREVPKLKGEVLVNFLDQQGEVLLQKNFSTRELQEDLVNPAFSSGGLRTSDFDVARLIVIAPTFSNSYVSETVLHRPSRIFTRKFEIPLAVLKRLVRLEVVPEYPNLSEIVDFKLNSQPKTSNEDQRKDMPIRPDGGGIF